MNPLERQTILITGASRGIGAEVAVRLADRDRHIVVNYREKDRRANDVANAIRAAGGQASTARADLCDDLAVEAMLGDISGQHGHLDVLVLNASGGLERHADPGYAMRLNRDAQVELTRRALALMRPGGRVVFITSHPAHFYGRKEVPVEYLPVAVSKRAGEDALREMQDTFHAKDVGFVVVSGDLVDGTFVMRLLERANPDAVAMRRAAGALPTVSGFAAAIVDVIESQGQDGQTIYVGGPDYLS
jgi:NAD(P)-dependent dehydrogenase (short-subunit alcohol dehydrogenase family)